MSNSGRGHGGANLQRLALFGGTFDPPHRAHLRVALAAAQAFALDSVLLAPAGRQPLKQAGASAPYADRLAMVQLLCAGHPQLQPSQADAPHPDGTPNYTADTLAQLAMQYPEAELYAIAGADAFLDLPRWREPDRLLSLAQWIVVSRPGFDLARVAAMPLTPAQHARVHLLPDVLEDVSATEIRERLRTGDRCPGLLTPEVQAYIAQHRLYV